MNERRAKRDRYTEGGEVARTPKGIRDVTGG